MTVAPEERLPCDSCDGEGGTGDERCAIMLCPACDGTGERRQGTVSNP